LAPAPPTPGEARAALPVPQRSIKTERVSYTYPGSDAPALSQVTLEIPVGRHVAIVGPSGAGKSTLLDLLLGLLEPSEGRLIVDDIPLPRSHVRAWRAHLSYVPQQLFLFDATLAENIALGVPSAKIDIDRVKDALRMSHLEDVVAALPEGMATRLGDRGIRLSGGERQRVGIARALYRRPAVLILDESTSALDAETERAINDELAELKGQLTLVVVSHRLDTLRSCDRLYCLDKGMLAASGTYEQILRARAAA
jgi:ABC-type multidrug transport system fused ATPase/permease subunit